MKPRWVLGFAALAFASAPVGCASSPESHPSAGDDEWMRTAPDANTEDAVLLVDEHLGRYPEMQSADIYKLLHQAFMGPAHAAPSVDKAYGWLTKEAAGLRPGGMEHQAEDPLLPGGGLVRVHLRPWLDALPPAAHGDALRTLAEAFVRSAQQVRPDPAGLEAALAAVATATRDRKLIDLVTYQRGRDYPAVSHSATYKRAYQPAYRVVLGALVP